MTYYARLSKEWGVEARLGEIETDARERKRGEIADQLVVGGAQDRCFDGNFD